jgi:hypothetical protein
MTMTPEAKKALSSTIRGLQEGLLEVLQAATESADRPSILLMGTGKETQLRQKLDLWLHNQEFNSVEDMRSLPLVVDEHDSYTLTAQDVHGILIVFM